MKSWEIKELRRLLHEQQQTLIERYLIQLHVAVTDRQDADLIPVHQHVADHHLSRLA